MLGLQQRTKCTPASFLFHTSNFGIHFVNHQICLQLMYWAYLCFCSMYFHMATGSVIILTFLLILLGFQTD
jgi:hypothetical protein